MTKVEALKELYVKLGGNASDVASVDNIAEMIEKVKNIAENGGELPDGGSNGQVLTKKTGGVEWADVPTELPSGGTEGQILAKGNNGPMWKNEKQVYLHQIVINTKDLDDDDSYASYFNLYLSTPEEFENLFNLLYFIHEEFGSNFPLYMEGAVAFNLVDESNYYRSYIIFSSFNYTASPERYVIHLSLIETESDYPNVTYRVASLSYNGEGTYSNSNLRLSSFIDNVSPI